MILIWLTAIIALAIVLALAGYLVMIAVALTQTWHDVARIADALEKTAANAAPLDQKVTALVDALRQLPEMTAPLVRVAARRD